ncbi:MAG: PDDEXK nuclease domain-containing protein [Bacteroidetes bacterium]|nr:PDDEXK nuclease domain-containing protein [Bacteroidota bacterium]
MDIKELLSGLIKLDDAFKRQVTGVVNSALTLRNWLFGYYIVEYEQKGEDRAKYGDQVLKNIADDLKDKIKGASVTNLKLYRQFYQFYPHIGQALSDKSIGIIISDILNEISQTLSDQSSNRFLSDDLDAIHQIASDAFLNSEDNTNNLLIVTSPIHLITRLSFSHFVELMKIDDPLKRAFYEIETIKGTWSVRELVNQIGRLLFERSGLSKNKESLIRYANKDIVPAEPEDIIRDPYVFDFLGLPNKELVKESDLEKALLDGIEEFLLELGNGFCFESRQKMILIGGEYFYVDLVFYHRILHSHVLIELKVDKFKHEQVSQLNTYVNYYNDVEKLPGDKETIGILMCTGANQALVKYATGGLNKNLFIREYLVNLPDENKLREFLEKRKQELK